MIRIKESFALEKFHNRYVVHHFILRVQMTYELSRSTALVMAAIGISPLRSYFTTATFTIATSLFPPLLASMRAR
jgi:hypothetical protein